MAFFVLSFSAMLMSEVENKWLLFVLIILCAYIGGVFLWNMISERKEEKRFDELVKKSFRYQRKQDIKMLFRDLDANN